MPVSYRHNCLFVHIPRTGGTSIEQALGIHREWPELDLEVFHGRLVIGSEEYQVQHLSYQELAQFLSPAWVDGCFSFAFCRNPWDRLVSSFHWSQMKPSFPEFVQWACEVVASRQELAGRHCHLRPQTEFIDPRLTFLGRFEQLQRDLETVGARLGLDLVKLPNTGATVRGRYADYYSDETRKLVHRTYEADVDLLGYRF